jgi:ribosome-associated toxin RatA of RatAB toxin-antitoxin module
VGRTERETPDAIPGTRLTVALVKKSALVPYSAEQMFELVYDVGAYPRFLPWCHRTEVLSESDEQICGRIEVARLGIHQTFSTCNRYERPTRMDIALLDGPFRKLHGGWRFTPLKQDACKVELELEFEFSGGLIDKAFGAVFSQIANSLVDAFCKRADEVYRV